MRCVFKLVFLFVGVVIGAGFATGSEIVLYFKNSGYISVVLASLIMGILSIIFCYFGRIKSKSNFLKNLMKIVVFLSSIVTYCVMISGVGELIYTQYGIKYFGVFTAFIVAILMLYDMRIIKLLNLVIVPMIIVIMIVLLAKSGGEIYSGFNISSSIKYAGMNMLLGGYFMQEEGDQLTHKQIFGAGVLVFMTMALLMSICYVISMNACGASMPVFEVARNNGLGVLASIVVYLAIFTTLIGSGRAFADMLSVVTSSKLLIFTLFFVLGIYFDGLDFGALVAFCYDEIGEMGVVICTLVIINLAFHIIKKALNKRNINKSIRLKSFI